MALVQHSNLQARFDQQVENARTYVLPFVEESLKISDGMRVMEIGCGEGGVLRPFCEKGAFCLGVDLSESRVKRAKQFMESEILAGKADFIAQNVYDDSFREKYQNSFDLILLKDTIEHIPEQEKFIPYLRQFLTENGQIFFGFPPWYMPFGGHQQICKSKILGFLPWYHLLPRPLYKGVLKLFGEPQVVFDELMDIKSTGISIERFERIIRKTEFRIEQSRFYLFNPIYRYKFGLKPRKQAKLLEKIPFLRNFVTTAVWYMISKQN
ncbi:MAG: class I SAM-dependent methyltransferase [Bacteroidia bacterium]|nr:class I SAM-dependent methyltransferase [Bacteroidia bacterium]